MRSIIFLCTANAIRSQMAEAYINAKTTVLKAAAHWGFKDVSGESRRHYRALRDEINAHLDKFLARYNPLFTDDEVRALLRGLSR
ncbi:MAG: hypothetical protein ACK4XY_04575 [Chloroherpetonaceae bacterium]